MGGPSPSDIDPKNAATSVDLGHLLRRLRDAASLTTRMIDQRTVHDRVRLTRAKISNVERGELPDQEWLRAFINVCGIATGTRRYREWETVRGALVDQGVPAPGPQSATPPNLFVDDVFVRREHDCIVLDVRVRNGGSRAANITRVTLRVLNRKPFLTAYVPSARYDILIDGDHNEAAVAHHVRPDDVDQFLLTLGFAPGEIGHVFTAELILRYNGGELAVSAPVTFDSCFG